MDRSRPEGVNRRDLLLGLSGTTLGAFVAAGPAQAALPTVSDAPRAVAAQADAVPFYGAHQAGVTTPRPAAGLVASFASVLTTPNDFEAMLRLLTERARFLTQGGPVPVRAPNLPPADSGLLGPEVEPDGLTVTVGLGASLFEKYSWLAGLAPARLERMTQFRNDALDAARCHGDLSIQLCANVQDTNIHALRDIVKSLASYLVLDWLQEGSMPPVAPDASGHTPSARNFLGFRDGSANPDSNDDSAMDRIVWAGGADEPDWAQGGTYQVVRIIRNFVERWDRTPLGEQERIFGRRKTSGAPLDAPPTAGERQVPDYTRDPDGAVTPHDAHIRLANPRTVASRANLMLRRPFNYSNGVTRAGQLDQGLLFICYQADLQAGFITVQRRLEGEPLEEYIKPVGGGYFFVLPGVAGPDDYLGSALVRAVRAKPRIAAQEKD